ncbi:MAG TPA: aminotransferase class IV [Prolixibacteraceae bacterium]|nr:aminotransferase class IV [Prolixibacteraceae bacterium]
MGYSKIYMEAAQKAGIPGIRINSNQNRHPFIPDKMSMGKYILINGSFVPTAEYRISLPESEAFLFSEKIRAIRTAFPFFKENLEMMKLKLLIFNLSYPEFTDNDGAGLKRQLERTLTKNKHFLGAALTFTLRFTEQKISYTIQSEKCNPIGYELNGKGLYVELFNKIQKPVSSLSNLSIGSAIYWNIAQKHIANTLADEFLIVNSLDQIIETPESNIYLIEGKKIRGASSEQGAYIDITRPLMLDIFAQLNLEYTENEGITSEDIREADEALIVNSIEGIRWIVGFEGKRFLNHTIREISELFNQGI